MESDNRRSLAIPSAAAIGVVAGLRSQMPLALLAWQSNRGTFTGDAVRPIAVLRSPRTMTIAALLAAGELIGDKLPMTPSRLEPGALMARFVIGGLAGAAVARNSRHSAIAGLLAGMAGAGVGAYGGYHLRRRIVAESGLPDPVVAVAEDALAVGIGLAALRDAGQASGYSARLPTAGLH